MRPPGAGGTAGGGKWRWVSRRFTTSSMQQKLEFAAFTSFCGINIPTAANYSHSVVSLNVGLGRGVQCDTS